VGVIADAYQRMQLALLPPGRLWRLLGESVLLDLFAGVAIELERFHTRALELLAESDPSTAVELLPEYESELDLEAAATTEERQARVVARHVARQRYRPVDFQVALAPIFGQLAADVVVLERTHAMAVAMGDAREIFDFFLYRDPTEPGAYYIDSAQELIDKIKPSHTLGFAIESIDFLCDDEFSLCDRDLLGA
jgi:uncharacterized protein YmfQ (DUF2313 family)